MNALSLKALSAIGTLISSFANERFVNNVFCPLSILKSVHFKPRVSRVDSVQKKAKGIYLLANPLGLSYWHFAFKTTEKEGSNKLECPFSAPVPSKLTRLSRPTLDYSVVYMPA